MPLGCVCFLYSENVYAVCRSYLRFLIWYVAIYTNVLKQYLWNRMHFYCCRLCKVYCLHNYAYLIHIIWSTHATQHVYIYMCVCVYTWFNELKSKTIILELWVKIQRNNLCLCSKLFRPLLITLSVTQNGSNTLYVEALNITGI
jgi:hypothetical protein